MNKWLKKAFVLMLIGGLLIGCSKPGNDVEQGTDTVASSIEQETAASPIEREAAKIETVFKEGDINKISQAIGLTDGDTQEPEDSIMNDLLVKASVTFEKMNDEEIVYTVKAPDMSSFFASNLEKISEMGTEDFEKFLREYMESAEVTEREVAVPYSMNGDEIVADYTDSDFIDAATGGLVQAYVGLYDLMIEEYKAYVDEQE